MLHFPLLRTRRFNLQLRELTMGESIALAGLPAQMEEEATTRFLKAATQNVEVLSTAITTDPLTWTVQERMFAVAHYLSCISQTGADFVLGDGNYSDYLDSEHEYALDSVDLGEIAGDTWTLQPLSGAMAQSIERLVGELSVSEANESEVNTSEATTDKPLPPRLHWLLGMMAAQLKRPDEPPAPDAALAQGSYDEHLIARMRILRDFPESDFIQLWSAFETGRQQLHHLFHIDIGADGGIVALARENNTTKEGQDGGNNTLPAARFPVNACISDLAQAMGRQPH